MSGVRAAAASESGAHVSSVRKSESVDLVKSVDLQCRCADAVDRRDWTTFLGCFSDDATTDLPRTGLNTDVRQMLASVQAVIGRLDATQHHLSNHRLTSDANGNVATCYVLAQHVRRDPKGRPVLYTFGGRYTDTLTSEGGGPRIAHRRLDIIWSTGDATILQA